MSFLRNKRVLITGASGSVGSELLKQVLSPEYGIAEVVGMDENESGLFFQEQRYLDEPRASFFLGDVRNQGAVSGVMKNIDVVFHAAALKHVALCERSPYEAVRSNILGVHNIVEGAKTNGVEVVIFTSSDKAVNPTNVMGTSKLMGERLITAANNTKRGRGPVFASTRFGNVLGSSGSVVQVFRRQIAKGGPVTLTHREMSRFIMTVEQAGHLVIESAEIARGGEVFITKMPVIRIEDLAEVMIRELAPVYGYDPARIEVEEIGAKPGEKFYEELMSQEETRRSLELENYFVVKPAFLGMYESIDYRYDGLVSEEVEEAYHSGVSAALTQEELTSYLRTNGLLESRGENEGDLPAKRYWPGESK